MKSLVAILGALLVTATMALADDAIVSGGAAGINKRFKDMGDGTHAEVVSVGPIEVGGATPITPVRSSALGNSLVLKGAAGTLHGLQVNFVTCATFPCWVMVLDAASFPGNGAVTPVKWYQLSANSTMGVSYSPPLAMASGATIGCSTTGPFTLTATAQCAISGEVQ